MKFKLIVDSDGDLLVETKTYLFVLRQEVSTQPEVDAQTRALTKIARRYNAYPALKAEAIEARIQRDTAYEKLRILVTDIGPVKAKLAEALAAGESLVKQRDQLTADLYAAQQALKELQALHGPMQERIATVTAERDALRHAFMPLQWPAPICPPQGSAK